MQGHLTTSLQQQQTHIALLFLVFILPCHLEFCFLPKSLPLGALLVFQGQ